MSGIFSTLNVANKGLQAQQTALHTTGHNISNANTEGYSRQRVELKADLAFTYGGVGQLGTGVKMDSIIRSVDDYVTKQIRQENGTLQQYTSKSEVLEQLETIFNEPSDTGLNFNLGEMFDSWQELSKNPESLNSKTIVVEKSKTMAETLNHIANQLQSLREDTTGQIEKNVLKFNTIVEKIDTLNKQIFNISIKGQVPNDLLDQRDVLLKDLSTITDFKADTDKYGRASITIGENIVLNESGQNKIGLIGTDIVMVDDTTKVLDINKGQIAGYREALKVLDVEINNLNNFANTMAKAINTVHGTDLFENFASAGSIKVKSEIQTDNSLVNAGKVVGGPEGDGSRALAIAGLRNTKLNFKDPNSTLEFIKDNDGNDTMNLVNHAGGTTIEGSYNDIITKVGISKEQSDNMVANQEVLLDQLVLRRESTSGVSIDEEVSNLIKFQKSFEANARVISVLSEMLDVLINRTGV